MYFSDMYIALCLHIVYFSGIYLLLLRQCGLYFSGMYCVLLIVYDDTNDHVLHANHRLARRFLLYDNVSQVETSNHTDHQMFVSSAAQNTSYEWITTLDELVIMKT